MSGSFQNRVKVLPVLPKFFSRPFFQALFLSADLFGSFRLKTGGMLPIFP